MPDLCQDPKERTEVCFEEFRCLYLPKRGKIDFLQPVSYQLLSQMNTENKNIPVPLEPSPCILYCSGYRNWEEADFRFLFVSHFCYPASETAFTWPVIKANPQDLLELQPSSRLCGIISSRHRNKTIPPSAKTHTALPGFPLLAST